MQKLKPPEKSEELRIVIDTNILVSAHINAAGPPAAILMECSTNLSLIPLYTDAIFDEYTRVLKRPKFKFSEKVIDETLMWFSRAARKVEMKSQMNVLLDPDDNRFLECAIDGDAAFIITGNHKHFPFPSWNDIQIVKPSDFIKIMREHFEK